MIVSCVCPHLYIPAGQPQFDMHFYINTIIEVYQQRGNAYLWFDGTNTYTVAQTRSPNFTSLCPVSPNTGKYLDMAFSELLVPVFLLNCECRE